jgi:Envelope integrity protein A
MEHAMQALMRTALLVLALVAWGTEPVLTQAYPPPASSPPPASDPPSQGGQYSSNEVVDAGHRFFGTVSRGLAEIVEKAGSQWGLPNGYVLGQEAGGDCIGSAVGLRPSNASILTFSLPFGILSDLVKARENHSEPKKLEAGASPSGPQQQLT